MALTTDIVATYRRPGAVLRAILARGPSEPRALAYLMAGCVVLFVARWPALARQAHLEDQDLNMLMGGSLLGLVFIAPLILYGLAFLVHLVSQATGGQGTAFGARMALFWSLLASAPLILLNGLVAGFIGPGAALQLVGLIWFGLFLWFWIAGMRVVREGMA